MIDPEKRAIWFLEYRRAARRMADRFTHPKESVDWARSMSLIAEQFIDNRDEEPATA